MPLILDMVLVAYIAGVAAVVGLAVAAAGGEGDWRGSVPLLLALSIFSWFGFGFVVGCLIFDIRDSIGGGD